MAWGFGSHASGRPITSDEITWPTLISDYVDQQKSVCNRRVSVIGYCHPSRNRRKARRHLQVA